MYHSIHLIISFFRRYSILWMLWCGICCFVMEAKGQELEPCDPSDFEVLDIEPTIFLTTDRVTVYPEDFIKEKSNCSDVSYVFVTNRGDRDSLTFRFPFSRTVTIVAIANGIRSTEKVLTLCVVRLDVASVVYPTGKDYFPTNSGCFYVGSFSAPSVTSICIPPKFFTITYKIADSNGVIHEPQNNYNNIVNYPFPLGINTVIYRIEDQHGYWTTYSFEVAVKDEQAPVAKCKGTDIPVMITLDAISGSKSISVSDIDDGSRPVCPLDEISLSIDNDFFTCDNLGNNFVTLTVTNKAGVSTTCTSTVFVQYDMQLLKPLVAFRDEEICSDEVAILDLIFPSLVTQVLWSWEVIVPEGISPNVGLGNPIPNVQSTISQQFSNTHDEEKKVTYIITPTIRYSLFNQCTLLPEVRDLWVNPHPKLLDIVDVTICNETPTRIPVQSSTSVKNAEIRYRWTVSSNILGAQGSAGVEYEIKANPFIPIRLVNPPNSYQDVNVTYTLYPSLHLNGKQCPSPDSHKKETTITVMPTPVIEVMISDAVICNDQQPVRFNITSRNNLSTKGRWRSDVLINPESGVICSPMFTPPLSQDDVFDQIITNNSNYGQTVSYIFIPRIEIDGYIPSCPAGRHDERTILVNPTPKMTAAFLHRDSICHNDGALINIETPTDQVFGTLKYDWEVQYTQDSIQISVHTGVVDFGNNAPTLHRSDLENISKTEQTVTYRFLPFIENGSFMTCKGNPVPDKELHIAPKLTFHLKTDTVYGGLHISCNGDTNGKIWIEEPPHGGWSAKGYQYAWNGNGIENASTSDITGLPAGKYNITVEDNVIGCKSYQEITLREPDVLKLQTKNIISPDCKYANGTIAVHTTGGTQTNEYPYQYEWNARGIFHHFGDSSSFTNLKSGIYTIVVVDVNQCKDSLTHNLQYTILSDVLDIGNPRQTNVSCFGAENGSLDPLPIPASKSASAYIWEYNGEILYKDSIAPGDPYFSGFGLTGDFRITDLAPGEYQLTIIDERGCELISKPFEITEPTPMVLKLEVQEASCDPGNDGSIKAIPDGGTPGYTYLWNNNKTTSEITELYADAYHVTVKDRNGCTETDSIIIPKPEPLTVNAIITSNYRGHHIDCYENSSGMINVIIENGRDGYRYEWSSGDTTKMLTNAKADIKYTVTVTDRFNCMGSDTITLRQPSPLLGEIEIVNITCPGDHTGSILTQVKGGVAPYHYKWSNQAPDHFIADRLPAGEYKVTVIDDNNCVIDLTAKVIEPPAFNVKIESNPAFCPETKDGVIHAKLSGGTSPYNYKWSAANHDDYYNRSGVTFSDEDISILDARWGFYTIELTDFMNCKYSHQIELEYTYFDCLRIPNAFSPNGDGANDYWEITVGDPTSVSRPLLHDLYPDAVVEVWSPNWGLLLFQSHRGYPVPWDGKYKGKYLPVNSYLYIIRLNNHLKPIIGNVTIIR